mmetsp:Transcript_94815/g.182221  ORF Transcript_94815/g.182221 Transcript_94815/m.182221 type:complete len:154 (+) Transcript_94815:1-462(+)
MSLIKGRLALQGWGPAAPAMVLEDESSAQGHAAYNASYAKLLAKHAEARLAVKRPRLRPEVKCCYLNSTSFEAEVSQQLAVKHNADLVCMFEVESSGRVRCRLYCGSEDGVSAAEVAKLYGGTGSSGEASFAVPHLDFFNQLWLDEASSVDPQ